MINDNRDLLSAISSTVTELCRFNQKIHSVDISNQDLIENLKRIAFHSLQLKYIANELRIEVSEEEFQKRVRNKK